MSLLKNLLDATCIVVKKDAMLLTPGLLPAVGVYHGYVNGGLLRAVKMCAVGSYIQFNAITNMWIDPALVVLIAVVKGQGIVPIAGFEMENLYNPLVWMERLSK